MIKNWPGYTKNGDTHPSEETLLKSLYGELPSREAARVREHLEICWTCRLSLEKIEETISTFVEFRQQVQIPLTQEPPNNWSDFTRKLNDLAASAPTPKNSRWLRNRFDVRRIFHNFASLSDWSPLQKQGLIGTLAAVLISVLLWQLIIIPPVSASELLDKSLQFQSLQIKAVSQAVVYQKLRVRKSNTPEINWEVWHDITRSRTRQNISAQGYEGPTVEIREVLKSNGFDPQQPLSALAFANWRKGLANKRDTVKETTADGGTELLALRTSNLGADAPGKIREAVLKVRSNDFHPVEQILHVVSASSVENYEFAELDFQVLSLTAFAPDFFPEPTQPQLASMTNPGQPANTNIAADNRMAVPTEANSANSAPTAPTIAASADLEVEVLRLLNQAKADLGEQITVKRENGVLYVRGVVETPQRKSEILDALRLLATNPAVRVEIDTYAEAAARQARQKSNTAVKQEVIAVDNQQAAAENELVEKLGTTAAARVFSTQMVERSWRAMNHAYALRRLSRQFTTDQLRQMKPQARAKWLALIASHAGAVRAETGGLRDELQRVFGAHGGGEGSVPAVDDWSDVPPAVEKLVEIASTNDRVIRSAFAVSAGSPRFSAIKTAQFWQSLKTAEALAAKLSQYRGR